MSTPQRRRPLLVDVLVRVLIGFVAVALVSHFVVRSYSIPSGSMEPTLLPGDRGFARIIGVDTDDLPRGAVIAFSHGSTWEESRLEEPHPIKDLVRYGGDLLGAGPSHYSYTVKRIIGLPGETVSCCDAQGRLLVDGEPLDEPYVTMDLDFTRADPCTSRRCFPDIEVPEDSYLVLGDHRAASSDSVTACRGLAPGQECNARFVRTEQVLGRLGWRWWPWPPGNALRES